MIRLMITIVVALFLGACDSAGSSQGPAGVDADVSADSTSQADVFGKEDNAVSNDTATQGDETSSPDTTPPVDYTGKWCSPLECYLQPGANGGWDCPPETSSMTPEGVSVNCGVIE